jgi:hypothetical protein
VKQVREDVLQFLLEIAEGAIADYLADGDPAIDFGEEWPEIARTRAGFCRQLAATTGNEGWEHLALALEDSAEGFERYRPLGG